MLLESMAVQGERLTSPRLSRWTPGRIWQGLRSMTFAIVMLSVILATIVAGSFLPGDSGIQQVYHSWWFYSLNFVLMVSVLSCASRRIRTVFRFAFRVPVVHRLEFYRASDTAGTLDAPLPTDAALGAVVKALRRRYYRVEYQQREGITYLVADRFRIMRMGTIVSHLSIVLMVATIAWGAIAGWLDQAILVEAGGAPVAIGHGTGLQLRSDSFDFGVYPDGSPRNFHDQLTVIEPSGAEHHQLIDVNTPWYYEGVFGYDIHQASYAVSARLIAIDTSAKNPTPIPYCVLQGGSKDCSSLAPLLLAPRGDGSYQPVGDFSAFYLPSLDLAVGVQFHDPVPNAKLPATVIADVLKPPRTAKDPMQFLRQQVDLPLTRQTFGGHVEQITDQPLTVKGIRFAFLVRRIAGLNIGHNPAVPFIFLSFTLILIGLVSVALFPLQPSVAVCCSQ